MCLFLDIVTMVLVTRQATRWATAFKTVSLTTKLPRANVRAAAVFRRVACEGLVPRGDRELLVERHDGAAAAAAFEHDHRLFEAAEVAPGRPVEGLRALGVAAGAVALDGGYDLGSHATRVDHLADLAGLQPPRAPRPRAALNRSVATVYWCFAVTSRSFSC